MGILKICGDVDMNKKAGMDICGWEGDMGLGFGLKWRWRFLDGKQMRIWLFVNGKEMWG